MAHDVGATRSCSPRRNIEHIRQIPEKLLDVTVQPLMFVLLFAYVFGGAIDVEGRQLPRVPDRRHPHPVARLRDGRPGHRDRHRPHRRRDRPVPLAARHPHGVPARPLPRRARRHGARDHRAARAPGCSSAGARTPPCWSSRAAILLLLAFASAMIWVGTWLGMMVRSPDAVMGVAFIVVFPLTFLSNAFVPIDSMPNVLQWVAAWNPVSVLVAAIRELFGNPIAPVDEAHLAARPPGPRRVPVLPRRARDRGARCAAPLPRPHHRLSRIRSSSAPAASTIRSRPTSRSTTRRGGRSNPAWRSSRRCNRNRRRRRRRSRTSRCNASAPRCARSK